MKPFTSHAGIAVPLRRSNVDTDQICSAQFLKRITKTGYEDALFAEWRKNADFILNQPEYQGASVLVVGPNFGTGSSREHAVWALRDYAFSVVIGPSFGDIFRGNSGKQGLLLATLPEEQVTKIWDALDASPGSEAEIDLVTQTVSCASYEYHFEIDAHTRYRLLNGLDDIGETLQYGDDIARFEDTRPAWKPRVRP